MMQTVKMVRCVCVCVTKINFIFGVLILNKKFHYHFHVLVYGGRVTQRHFFLYYSWAQFIADIYKIHYFSPYSEYWTEITVTNSNKMYSNIIKYIHVLSDLFQWPLPFSTELLSSYIFTQKCERAYSNIYLFPCYRDLHLDDVTDFTMFSDTKFLVKRATEVIMQHGDDAKETKYEFS